MHCCALVTACVHANSLAAAVCLHLKILILHLSFALVSAMQQQDTYPMAKTKVDRSLIACPLRVYFLFLVNPITDSEDHFAII